MYWYSAFFSLRHIVDYTVVRGLSTRGTQTTLYYFTNFSEWTNAFALVMALVGAAFGAWRALLWTALPVLMLSALPHKEARYLIPVLPFIALLAAVGITGTGPCLGRRLVPIALLRADCPRTPCEETLSRGGYAPVDLPD